MEYIIGLLKRDGTRRIIILAFLVLIIYFMRSILNLLLLTFIFTYLMYRIQQFLNMWISKFARVGQKLLVVTTYFLLLLAIGFGLYKFLPSIIQQSNAVINEAVKFYNQPHESAWEKYIISLLEKVNIENIDFNDYIHKGVGFILGSLNSIGKLSLDILFAFILSLFFLLEKTRIARFTQKFKTSKIASIYNEIEYFGVKFVNSFGKVIEAQFVIALVNCILSTIALSIMGFPQVLGLAIMIFILGLIPVAGVFISLVPLSLIGFNEGGFMMVIYLLIMITILHAIEAYILNPKLMSSKTELPVFYSFMILLIGEHFFGIWGLLIGIPIFMFILDLIDVKSSDT
jgi:predicted PurR-regulated permease PerM